MKKFLAFFPLLLLLNACTGNSWIKQQTSKKEPAYPQSIQTQEVPPANEAENISEETLPKEEITTPVPVKEETSPSKQAKPQTNLSKTSEQINSAPEQKQAGENTETSVNENEQIFLTSEQRLAHPWYYAKQATPPANTPKWFGEELKFDISWSFITAGKAQLNSSQFIEANGQKMYLLEAYAQSYPVIDAIFKVRDINMSWITEDLTRSAGYWQSVKEGSYARDEWLIFDYKTNTYTIHKKDKKGNIEHKPHEFKGTSVVDMLSSLYFVRNQELPLKGEVFFDIVNRGEQYPLKVIVLGKEKVKVKAGKFNCIVVEPVISGEGIFVSKGKSLKVWLTDDEYKMPVKMAVEVFIGSVKAELTEYSRK